MVPLRILLSSYAIIGLTLFILAASITVYLLRLNQKSRATWALIVFFALVAISGLTMIMANAIFHWDRLFVPWQDFWILAGGVALVYFAYSLPQYEPSLEARTAVLLMGSLAFLALAYSIFFDYRFLFHWTPDLNVNDAYYLLLPLGTLLIVFIFLRRSLHLSAGSGLSPEGSSIGQRLIHPRGDDALALRNMALALSLAFLPGLQTLAGFPYPYGFLLSNIGSILATIAIALVYFNYAPEVNSFMAKLVGINLTTVLLIVAVAGAVDVYLEQGVNVAERQRMVASIYDALASRGDLVGSPRQADYIVSWNLSQAAEGEGYRQLYPPNGEQSFYLEALIAENQEGAFEMHGHPLAGDLPQITNAEWHSIMREWISPLGPFRERYQGYIFTTGGVAYEIGFSLTGLEAYQSKIVSRWLLLLLAASAFVLLVFPLFFRRTLVQPLLNLLHGVRRVNRGDMDTFVPIRFHDEIGSLTDSFNMLTQSLKVSQMRQEELFNRLQVSYEELEERVADRTRELSAFTDLTMLAGDYDDLTDILQPALNRIMEVGLCEALCVHQLAEERDLLTLVAQRNLSQESADNLAVMPAIPLFSDVLQQVDHLILASPHAERFDLPQALKLPAYRSYLGSPLVAGDQVLGWLSCYREAEDDFTMGEISLLVALARQMGVIMENQRLRQQIKSVAAFEERQRLARDLHDSVTQLVYSMALFTRSSQDALEDGDEERLAVNLAHMADTSLQALREMRFMLFELQPPVLEREGLAKALNARFDMVERRLGIRAELNVDGVIEQEGVERELYYVAIEALNNTLKYAAAAEVILTVTQENGCLRLCIADNGRGFDPAQESVGLGINNMRQRIQNLGGELRIDSTIDGGTRVIATIPN